MLRANYDIDSESNIERSVLWGHDLEEASKVMVLVRRIYSTHKQ